MNKRDFFIKGLQSGAGKKRAWVMACFSYIVKDGPRQLFPDYPYRLFKVGEDLYFIDPEPVNPTPATELLPANLTKIDDYVQGEPLFEWLEPFTLNPGELENYQEPTPLITTPGNVYVNHLIFCLPLGSVIPFMSGHIDMGKVGDKILQLLVDDPDDDDGVSRHPEGKIYCRQLNMHNEYALTLTAWAEDNVVPITPKSLTGHPDREKVKAEEINKYKDRLNDPAIIARIGNKLEALDLEYMQGDPSFNFYMSKKTKLVSGSRKKQFYMFGGEAPFEDGTTMEFISKSLEDGLDINHMQVMVNTQRAGSFSRGFQTRLGGEKTKTIYRMLGTVSVESGDCGDTVGIPIEVNLRFAKSLIGFYHLVNSQPVLITEDNIKALDGTTINLRLPAACKNDSKKKDNEPGKGKNICSVCSGVALAQMPEGIPAAAAAVGGRFMTLALKKMHASSLKTTRWSHQQQIT